MNLSLSNVLLAVFLILFGINGLGWVAVSAFVLGLLALLAGIVLLIEGYRPITILKR